MTRIPPEPTWFRVLRHLDQHGAATSRQVRESLNIPRRTFYAAVKHLLQLGYIRERPNLRDMREVYLEPVVRA